MSGPAFLAACWQPNTCTCRHHWRGAMQTAVCFHNADAGPPARRQQVSIAETVHRRRSQQIAAKKCTTKSSGTLCTCISSNNEPSMQLHFDVFPNATQEIRPPFTPYAVVGHQAASRRVLHLPSPQMIDARFRQLLRNYSP